MTIDSALAVDLSLDDCYAEFPSLTSLDIGCLVSESATFESLVRPSLAPALCHCACLQLPAAACALHQPILNSVPVSQSLSLLST